MLLLFYEEVISLAKSKYEEWLEPDGLLRIAAWARDGLILDQIAHNMGIARKTLTEWRLKYSSIGNALKRGKEVVDVEVENSLFQKTQGYTVQLKKTFKVRRTEYDENGRKILEQEELQIGIDEIHVPADTTAMIFWLKNRKTKEWRDKQDVEVTGKDGGAIEIESPLDKIEKKLSLIAARIKPDEQQQ